jgi:MYXO-CTERM domain-containing protein
VRTAPPGWRSLRAAVVAAVVISLPPAAWGAQATVSWDPDADPTLQGYRVHYDRDSGAPYAGVDAAEGPSPIIVPLAALPDPTHPAFTLTGLDSCVTYYFAVQAYYTAGESGLSPEAASVLVAAPASVTVTVPGPRSLRVEWPGPPAGDAGAIPTYRVHYDVDSGPPYEGTDAAEGASPIAVQTASLFDPAHPRLDLTQLRAGQTYYVVVESVCPNGTSKPSEEVSGATPGQVDAGAPDGPGPADGGPGQDAAGADGGPIRVDAGSCGCRAAGGGGTIGWLLGLLGLLLLRRRRGAPAGASRPYRGRGGVGTPRV